MKRKLIIVSLLVTMALSFSGCGSKAQDSSGQSNASASQDGKQGQIGRADLSGEVTSISGNDVVVKLIEMSGPRQNNAQNQGQQQNKDSNQNQKQNQGQGRSPGKGQGRELKYTGETKTISVPSGTAVTTFERGSNGRQSKNIELKDIKQGDIIQIWYSDKEKGTIERISVMPGRGADNADKSGNAGDRPAQ